MKDNVIKFVPPERAFQKENSSIEQTKKLAKIQLIVNLVLTIFLIAMESSRIWLEEKVERLEEKVDALTDKLNHTRDSR